MAIRTITARLYEPEDYSIDRVRSASGLIAEVIGDSAETQANARLIAAAPELLASLKWAMHHVENVFALAGPHDRELPELGQARAAIAKVEGR